MIQKNRVIKVNRGYWEIFDGEKLVRGIINNSYLGKTMPVVGDFVKASKIDDTKVLILDVQERKNELVKEYDEKNLKITKSLNNGKQIVAANIDVVFIVSSLNNEFNIGKIERLLILANLKNAKRCLVLSKKDLCKDYETYVKEITERFPQLQVILTSIVTGEGKDEIFEYWKPRQTAIFIGSSGVGKSSLVNMLGGEQKAKTGEIRMRDDKGKHTTSASTLFDQMGLKNWCHVKNNSTTYKYNEYEFCFQNVENLGLFIEFEEEKFMKDMPFKEKVELMKNVLNSLGLKLGDNYFCKKIEMLIKK